MKLTRLLTIVTAAALFVFTVNVSAQDRAKSVRAGKV